MPSREPTVISGAVEGDVDEAVLRRLVEDAGGIVGPIYGKKGKALLCKRLAGYNNAARFQPWIVLVDLDEDEECAPPFRSRHLPKPADRMCFQVVIRSVEAWLMADRQRLARFLGVAESRVPAAPERETDPKRTMVQLATQSRFRAIREDMAPSPKGRRPVGPAYTSRMIEFALDNETGWRPSVAAQRADSLRRCVECLESLVRRR